MKAITHITSMAVRMSSIVLIMMVHLGGHQNGCWD